MKRIALSCALAFSLAGCATPATFDQPQLAAAQDMAADGWITAPDLAADDIPAVLNFRRVVDIKAVPGTFPVEVTADNRFILYVNGRRVASGPSTGDISHWRVERIDLAPFLKAGSNVIAAKVWNGVKPVKVDPDASEREREMARGRALFTQTAPLFQQSVATGFRLLGVGAAHVISTGLPGWRVARDEGRGFVNGWSQLRTYYYVAGAAEAVDAARSPADWNGPDEVGQGWADAVAAPAAQPRGLVADKLPQQLFALTDPGKVVRSDPPGGHAFPAAPVTVPANSKATLLVDRGSMVSAYPELAVSGGAGAKIALTYSEALYDAKGAKGDRDLVDDRKIKGLTDRFVADGSMRTLGPLWWRTWRFMEIAVETGDEPLTLAELQLHETGYPFQQLASFSSDDPQLNRIFDIGWRTARVDAHETYMDTSYWEQLQYVGDTRLQMLISYAVAGDPRLAENAIDQIAASRTDDGLVEGAYPTRSSNVIATFSPLWVAMLDDWRMHQPDPAPIRRNLPRMREILGWVDKWQAPSGLLTKNPEWNFIDWAGQASTDRDKFPSFGQAAGESCLTTAIWLGAMQQGAQIERQLGDQQFAARYEAQAAHMRNAIRNNCWNEERGLYADNPDLDQYSQHMNVLAVLYDVADAGRAKSILDRITVPGRGIDAPEDMREVSYYFAWYLVRAFEHAGQPERYFDLLQTWRDLLELNYTTWPEERGRTRSDTHAWSAHPTADLLAIVAGVGPGSPGYGEIRIAPHLGPLRHVEASVATPHGVVHVEFRRQGDGLSAVIELPKRVPAFLEWGGEVIDLCERNNKFEIAK